MRLCLITSLSLSLSWVLISNSRPGPKTNTAQLISGLWERGAAKKNGKVSKIATIIFIYPPFNCARDVTRSRLYMLQREREGLRGFSELVFEKGSKWVLILCSLQTTEHIYSLRAGHLCTCALQCHPSFWVCASRCFIYEFFGWASAKDPRSLVAKAVIFWVHAQLCGAKQVQFNSLFQFTSREKNWSEMGWGRMGNHKYILCVLPCVRHVIWSLVTEVTQFDALFLKNWNYILINWC